MNRFAFLLRTVCAIAAGFALAGPASAQSGLAMRELKIEVNVAAPFEPVSAIGIIFTPTKVIEKAPLSLRKVRDGFSVVSLQYDQSEATKDAFVSAMVVSKSGERAFGDIRRLGATNEPRDSFFNLAACPAEKLPGSVVLDRTGRIGALVEVRADRRAASQKLVGETLSGDFLERLTKLEHFFGLAHGMPLSPEMNPADLTDRLSRLKAAINNYEIAKQEKN